MTSQNEVNSLLHSKLLLVNHNRKTRRGDEDIEVGAPKIFRHLKGGALTLTVELPFELKNPLFVLIY